MLGKVVELQHRADAQGGEALYTESKLRRLMGWSPQKTEAVFRRLDVPERSAGPFTLCVCRSSLALWYCSAFRSLLRRGCPGWLSGQDLSSYASLPLGVL